MGKCKKWKGGVKEMEGEVREERGRRAVRERKEKIVKWGGVMNVEKEWKER